MKATSSVGLTTPSTPYQSNRSTILERSAVEFVTEKPLSSLSSGSNLGHDSLLAQIGHQQVEAAEPEIAGEDAPDLCSLSRIDGYLAILLS